MNKNQMKRWKILKCFGRSEYRKVSRPGAKSEIDSKSFGDKRFSLKRVLTYSVIVMVVISLVFIPNFTSAVTSTGGASPQYISCYGQPQENYNGYVYDQESQGVGGVVLYIFSPSLYQGGSGPVYVTTNSAGYWSTSLIECGYDADLYWQSSSNGPYLTEETTIPLSSSYTVDVWQTPAVINVTYEYPHTTNATFTWGLTTSWYLSINAQISGKISDGFLGVNAAGKVGTTETITTSTQFEASSPYVVFYPTGLLITVEASNGSEISYFETYTISSLSSMNANDYMTLNQAWSESNNSSYNSVVEISPGGQRTVNDWMNNTVAVDSKVSVSASIPLVGSVTFTTEIGVGSGTSQEFSIVLTNPVRTENACFMVYQGGINYTGGPEVHIWQLGYAANNTYCTFPT